MNSGLKYRGACFRCWVAIRDQIDSPPSPVADGSPTCARKSFDTIESIGELGSRRDRRLARETYH